MGDEIDLFSQISILRNKLSQKIDSLPNNRDGRNIFLTLVEFADINSSFQKLIGIGVGSVILVNQAERKNITLFDRHSNDVSFSLPYADISEPIVEDILDDLFVAWRSCEDLGYEDSFFSSSKFPPEYSYYMSRFSLDNERSSHEADHVASNVLSISRGETLFFMLAWRYLIRLIQFDYPDLNYNLYDHINPNSQGPVSAWEIFSQKLQIVGTAREHAFIAQFNDKIPTERLNYWKKNITSAFDNSLAWWDGVCTDLVALQLIQTYPTNASSEIPFNTRLLVELNNYINYILNLRGLDGVFPKNILLSSSPNGELNIAEFTNNFLAVLTSIVLGEHAREVNFQQKLVSSILDSLHKYARFPVIPYFYWCAITKNLYSHIAIPVWRLSSSTYPIYNINSEKMISQLPSCEYIHNAPPDVYTDVVAYAVFGITSPVFFDQQSCLKDKLLKLNDKVNQSFQINLIEQYIDLFSPHVIDLAFYATVQRSRDRERYVRTIVHDVKNQVSFIRENLIRDVADPLIDIDIKFQRTIRMCKYLQKNIETEEFIHSRTSSDDVYEPIDLRSILEELADRYKAVSFPIKLDYDDEIPSVMGRTKRLELIFNEFVCNIIKHNKDLDSIHPERTLSALISVKYHNIINHNYKLGGCAKPGLHGYILCNICDNGFGIKDDMKFSEGLTMVSEELQSWSFPESDELSSFKSDIWFHRGVDGIGSIFNFILPVSLLKETI